MQRTVLALLAVAFAVAPAATFSQAPAGPTSAIDITDAEVKTVLKNAPPAVDRQLRVVDMGKYNLAVGIIHRRKSREPAAVGGVSGIAHDNTAETYIIVSGGGTLVTGGTIQER